jgi:Ca2+-binding RTX toxin-like protein
MHRRISAGPRRRTRRALLAAALAAVALPSAAHAATAEVNNATPNGVLGYFAADGEVNNVRVSVSGTKLVISDGAPITAHNGCTLNAQGDAECPIGVDQINLLLRDKNDVVQYAAPHRASVGGEDGDDIVFGGLRQAVPGRSIQPVFYFGGAGRDTVTYSFADRGVRVDSADNPASGRPEDGRPGDLESVGSDIERIEGSNFADVLFGSPNADTMIGLAGRDFLAGGEADDLFLVTGDDGADDYHGGPGRDTIDYTGRTQALTVQLDNVADDGEFNEHDNVRSNVENVIGGSARDTLHSFDAFSRLEGRGGDDLLFGESGPDTLIGGPGVDLLDAGSGNDVVDARDGGVDDIFCGSESDTLSRDPFESRVSGCESVQVGTLRYCRCPAARRSWSRPGPRSTRTQAATTRTRSPCS